MFAKIKFFELVDQDAKAYGLERLTIPFFVGSLLGLSPFSAVLLYRVGSALYDKGFAGAALAKLAYKCNYWWNSCEIRPQSKNRSRTAYTAPYRRPYRTYKGWAKFDRSPEREHRSQGPHSPSSQLGQFCVFWR